MMHPIRETLTCGKAVWQHVGNKKKEKIRIKGPHKCKGSDYRVDAPRPTTTTILTVEPPETSTITSLASTTVTMVAETQVETLTVTLGF